MLYDPSQQIADYNRSYALGTDEQQSPSLTIHQIEWFLFFEIDFEIDLYELSLWNVSYVKFQRR